MAYHFVGVLALVGVLRGGAGAAHGAVGEDSRIALSQRRQIKHDRQNITF